MNYFVVTLLLGLALAIGGCVGIFARVETASRAQSEMIGLNKSEILACMGAPAAKETAGETEVWSYPSGGDAVHLSSGSAYASGGTAYGSAVTRTIQRYCVVDVVMQNGVVTRVNYQGRTGGWATEGEQCAFAVENRVQY